MTMKFKYISLAILFLSMCACASKGDAKGTEMSMSDDAAAAKECSPVSEVKFSADSAYKFVKEQVEFGPRVPGTRAHAECHDYLVDKLSRYGAAVSLQDTMMRTSEGKQIMVKNILGRYNQSAPRQIMLLAHYDTRPWADQDADPAKHNVPIDGANDGASGVAVLLEIARNASDLPDDCGLMLLMVDAEDSGSYDGDDRTWCLGSQAYADAVIRGEMPRPAYAILLDMVGGNQAVFPREYFSQYYAPAVCNLITKGAEATGNGSRFPSKVSGAVNDDHCYLIEAGIPTADIIDAANPLTGSFPATWHTMDDNLSNIDLNTLGAVGEVISWIVYNK